MPPQARCSNHRCVYIDQCVDSIRFVYDIDTVELTRGVDFMCGCIYGLVRSHRVSHGLVRSLTVSHGLSRSCTIAYTIIHGHDTSVSFLKVLKIVHGFHGYTRRPECNSDKATVGSVVWKVYTDGQPYKPCVLCQTGFRCMLLWYFLVLKMMRLACCLVTSNLCMSGLHKYGQNEYVHTLN